MIGAGHSTTANALSSIVFRHATDPCPQAQLRTRITVADIEVGGVAIPAGSLVALNFCAANLDREEFAHPARLEMMIAIEQLLSAPGASSWMARMTIARDWSLRASRNSRSG